MNRVKDGTEPPDGPAGGLRYRVSTTDTLISDPHLAGSIPMAKVFRVSGTFRTGHHDQPFSKELVASDDKAARELMLSLLGSKHAVPRRLIKIHDCKEVAPDQVESAVVRHQARV